ncbi:MAG: PotD/PotF family extracellular solute-binding protein [Alphaproteobacteria bacterium]
MARLSGPRGPKALRGLTRRAFLGGAAGFGAALAARAHADDSSDDPNLVSVYSWEGYFAPDTLGSFTAATGIEVHHDVFASNEEMFTTLKSGGANHDVVFASDYMVETMIGRAMLAPLDHDLVPNIRHIDPAPAFSDPRFNPGLAHGVPYIWGTMGLGYRRARLGRGPESWGLVFEPARSAAFAGRIALPADPRATIGFALKYLGHSLNATDSEAIAQARNLLISAKPNLHAFAPDSGEYLLLRDEVDLAAEWNGDIIDAQGVDRDIGYAVPREGSVLWIDNVCIPAAAPRPANAHAFINHLLDPEVNAAIANYLRYATPNWAAREMVDPGDLNDPVVYAPPGTVADCETIVDVGDFRQLYDAAWDAILAA